MVKYVRSVAITEFDVEDGSRCQVTAVYEDGSKTVVDAEYSYYSQDEGEKFVGCVRDGMVCDVTLRAGIAGLSASHMVELSHACIDLYEEGTNIASDEKQPKLTIAHKNGDCGYYTTGNTFDIYEVSDGTNAVLVKYTYDENGDTVTVSNEEACKLHSINGSMHLIACVNATLLKHFTEEHSFYCEAFTDEDGNEIVHDLIVL